MNLERKKAVVEDLKTLVSSNDFLVLVSHGGLTVNETNEFRRELRGEGAGFRVIKNSLFSRALESSDRSSLDDLVEGPVAVAFTDSDPAFLAKVLSAFIKKTKNRIEVKGGFLGKKPIESGDVKALASLPPIEILKGKLLGTLVGVPQKLLGLLQAPGRGFVGLLKARENQLGDEA